MAFSGNKRDFLPVNSGDRVTLIAVYNPQTSVDSRGGTVRSPGGGGGITGSASLGAPLWMDSAQVLQYGAQLGNDESRPVTETWSQILVLFDPSKKYRSGLFIQLNSTGQIFEIQGSININTRNNRVEITARLVA